MFFLFRKFVEFQFHVFRFTYLEAILYPEDENLHWVTSE